MQHYLTCRAQARPFSSTCIPTPFLIPPTSPFSTAFMPTVGHPTSDQRPAHAARHAAAILNAAPPAATLQSDLILPIARHVVARFTAWLQEDNHPHRALCQEDSEASLRVVTSLIISALSSYPSLIQIHLLCLSHLHRPAPTSLSGCCASSWCSARPRLLTPWRARRCLSCGRATRSCWSPWPKAPPQLCTVGKDGGRWGELGRCSFDQCILSILSPPSFSLRNFTFF